MTANSDGDGLRGVRTNELRRRVRVALEALSERGHRDEVAVLSEYLRVLVNDLTAYRTDCARLRETAARLRGET